MFTRHFTRPFQVAIAAGALSALFAAAPAQASDQSGWLQEQLAISDGSSSASFVSGARSIGSTHETDSQTVWLQEQLAISDGTSYISFVPDRRTGGAYKMETQSVWLQQQLAISDGSVPIDGGDAAVYADGPRTTTASAE
jgi:hypothetical protein